MTDALRHSSLKPSKVTTLVFAAAHAGLGALAVASRLITGIMRDLASTPAAVSKAFTMAYMEPFHNNRRDDDYCEPSRF